MNKGKGDVQAAIRYHTFGVRFAILRKPSIVCVILVVQKEAYHRQHLIRVTKITLHRKCRPRARQKSGYAGLVNTILQKGADNLLREPRYAFRLALALAGVEEREEDGVHRYTCYV